MSTRRDMILQGYRAALKMRQRANLSLWEPICPFDLAEAIGVDVRFQAIGSLEGLYVRNPGPVIIVSSLRPAGRQAFTCAHELGHHHFSHGYQVHQYLESASQSRSKPQDEILADAFAAHLLMPKSLVARAFHVRGWSPTSVTAAQVFVLAGWLGVSYDALVTHLEFGLGLISTQWASGLRRETPKSIRAKYWPGVPGDLMVIDPQWGGRSVDVRVGDHIVVTGTARVEEAKVSLVETTSGTTRFQAQAPGVGRIVRDDADWAVYVRISKRDYEGLSRFRHLEDGNDED